MDAFDVAFECDDLGDDISEEFKKAGNRCFSTLLLLLFDDIIGLVGYEEVEVFGDDGCDEDEDEFDNELVCVFVWVFLFESLWAAWNNKLILLLTSP